MQYARTSALYLSVNHDNNLKPMSDINICNTLQTLKLKKIKLPFDKQAKTTTHKCYISVLEPIWKYNTAVVRKSWNSKFDFFFLLFYVTFSLILSLFGWILEEKRRISADKSFPKF